MARPLVAIALALVLLGLVPTGAAAGEYPMDAVAGRTPVQILTDAVARGHQQAWTGETVVMERRGEEQVVTRTAHRRADGAVGDVVGWTGVPAVTDKYTVTFGGVEYIVDRRTVRLDVHLRGDGTLRERMWIDGSTGLFLRRETYADDPEEPERLITYLSLDLQQPLAVAQQARQVLPVTSDAQLAALRAAGWVLPEQLPGGYRLVGVLVLPDTPGAPVQAIYSDGLYAVSLFSQPGVPDFDTLPDGAVSVEEVPTEAFEWPGTSPARMVWAGDGHVLSLVGDAPRHELVAMVEDLPAGDPQSLADRLVRGLRRIAGALAPW